MSTKKRKIYLTEAAMIWACSRQWAWRLATEHDVVLGKDASGRLILDERAVHKLAFKRAVAIKAHS